MIIKNLRYVCLMGVIALALITIVGSNGGGETEVSDVSVPPATTSPYAGAWINFLSGGRCCMLSNYTLETSDSGLAVFVGQCGGGSKIDICITPDGEVHSEIWYGSYSPCDEYRFGEINGTCPTKLYCDGTITTDIGEVGFTMKR